MKIPGYKPTLDYVHWLLSNPLEELTRLQRTLRYMLDFGRYCAQELREDRAGEMAAALTYHTLFSLLPTIAMMLAIMPVFVDDAQREALKDDMVDFALSWIQPEGAGEAGAVEVGPDDGEPGEGAAAGDGLFQLDGGAGAPAGESETSASDGAGESVAAQNNAQGVEDDADAESGTGPPLTAAERQAAIDAAEAKREFEQARANIARNVEELITRLEKINFTSIGVVGVILFLYAATRLLSTVEHSFNRIYDAPYARPMYLRFPLYFTVLTLSPILVLAGQVAQAQAIGLIEQTAAMAGQEVSWLSRFATVVTPFVAMWLTLVLLYQFMPNTRVQLRASILGGSVAAIGWTINIEAFKWYAGNYGIAGLYGALALVPLFLFWLWVTWLIVLFGLEVTYTAQSMRGRRFKTLRSRLERNVLFDPRWMIPIVSRIAQDFNAGNAVRLDELKSLTGLPERAVRRLIQTLTDGRFIHHVEQEDRETPAYALAKPPDQITIAQLLEVAHHTAMQDRKWQAMPGGGMLKSIQQAERDATNGMTVADVINRNGSA